jgi:hypothetical protein
MEGDTERYTSYGRVLGPLGLQASNLLRGDLPVSLILQLRHVDIHDVGR